MTAIFVTMSRSTLRYSQPGGGGEVTWLEHEADMLSPSRTKFKNAWKYISLHVQHLSMMSVKGQIYLYLRYCISSHIAMYNI